MTIKRLNYATGQLLTAVDFQDEQDYHRNQRLRHNQSLHTPGVVSGLTVTKSAANQLTVALGFALDMQGQEIVLTEPARIDTTGLDGTRRYCIAIRARAFPDPLDNAPISGVPFCTRTTETYELLTIVCTFDPVSQTIPLPPLNGGIALATIQLASGSIYRVTDVRRFAGSVVSNPLPMPLGIGVDSPESTLTINSKITAFGFGSAAGAVVELGNINSDPTQIVQGNKDGFVSFGWGFNSPRAHLNVNDRNPLVLQDGLGNVGIGNISPQYKLDVTGNLNVSGNLYINGAKSGYVVDRFVNRIGAPLELGDVVVIGSDQPAFHYGLRDNIPVPEVDYAASAYDTRVCGIVCEVHGELIAESPATEAAVVAPPKAKKGVKAKAVKRETSAPAKLSMRSFSDAEMEVRSHATVEDGQVGFMVTLGAFAHCKVDADIAAIKAGDLLTTSPTPGHAQKVLDRSEAIGAIIGKALAPLKKGKGKIPVMVMMQ